MSFLSLKKIIHKTKAYFHQFLNKEPKLPHLPLSLCSGGNHLCAFVSFLCVYFYTFVQFCVFDLKKKKKTRSDHIVMSFLRFLALECLRKSRVCMFRCNWTCLVRWPGSILSAGLRAHGPSLLTCWHRMAGNVAIASHAISSDIIALSAEEVTSLWQRHRDTGPLYYGLLFFLGGLDNFLDFAWG